MMSELVIIFGPGVPRFRLMSVCCPSLNGPPCFSRLLSAMRLAGRVSIILGLVATAAAFAPCRPVSPLWASGRSARPNTVARLGATTVSRPETTTPFQTSTAYNPSPDGSQVSSFTHMAHLSRLLPPSA